MAIIKNKTIVHELLILFQCAIHAFYFVFNCKLVPLCPFICINGISKLQSYISSIFLELVIERLFRLEKYIYCNIYYIMSGDMKNCGEIHGDLEIEFLKR